MNSSHLQFPNEPSYIGHHLDVGIIKLRKEVFSIKKQLDNLRSTIDELKVSVSDLRDRVTDFETKQNNALK